MKNNIHIYLSMLTSVLMIIPFARGASELTNETATPLTATLQPPAVRVIDAVNGNEPLVTISFNETPLTDVIKAFRDATKANIISGGTNLQGTVSVSLVNVPWRKGLSSILEPQGMQLIEQPADSGIFIVTEKITEAPKITKVFELAHAKADAVAKLFASTLGKTGTATPFPYANSVIITAPDKQIKECEAILKTIDQPRPQVYIEARFVELSAGASKKLGLRWESLGGDGWGVNLKKATLDLDDTLNAVATKSKDPIFSGQLSAEAFRLALNAFEQIDGASVFSNPKIIVANEETATVDMTVKEPNVEVKASRSASISGNNLDITTTLALIPGKAEPFVGEAFFSYGIALKVTPRVSSSDIITVQIEPSISEKDLTQGGDSDGKNKGYYVIQAAVDTPTTKYPIIKISRIQTVFAMMSGSTAVIGGLSQTKENNVDSGIPFLRKIPWIGPHIFGWKSRTKEQKEIVIFVTVGIANPKNMQKDIGLPKNAVLGRDLLNGKTKEPGDRTKEELLNLDDPAAK